MKVALLGAGKTGGQLVHLITDILGPFTSQKPPTVEELKRSDLVISFVPGHAVNDLIPLLLESRKPVVWGSTGMLWPEDLDRSLKTQGLTWLYASNFSLGMVLIRQALSLFKQADQFIPDVQFSLSETHHQHKKDRPSGTALSWKQWLGKELSITSHRIADVVGEHEVVLESPYEKITLKHESKDRALFAEGAYWSAKKLFELTQAHAIEPGLWEFHQFIQTHLLGGSYA